MGLHIYSGPLCRIVSNDWDNEIAAWARETGNVYTADYGERGQPDWFAGSSAIDAAVRFQHDILEALGLPPGASNWSEGWSEYFTMKIHDEGRSALAIFSTCLSAGERLPSEMPSNPNDVGAYSEASERGYLVEAVAPLEASIMVPSAEQRFALITDPFGQERLVGTTGALAQKLMEIRQHYWTRVSETSSWLNAGLAWAVGEGEIKAVDGNEEFIASPQPPDALAGNARYGFAVFERALAFSDRHQMPIWTSW